jgi:hypothetical protein
MNAPLIYRAIANAAGFREDNWTIERSVPNKRSEPVLLRFRGTRAEAEAEAARLSGLAKIAESVADFAEPEDAAFTRASTDFPRFSLASPPRARGDA